ncbi:NEPYR [Mytilus edulis]|uniref:Rya-R n=1 Tax=Mytilus edulis TaxID=6550 RepID=A0A8S3R170_MYTED|nr:NEPYR [Mytilus edulis]
MTVAINDMLVIIFCIPFIKLNKLFSDSWKFGTIFCGIVGYLQWVLILQKSFNIVVIICDRHYIVARPLKQRLSKRTSQFIIFGTYVLAAAIALPTALHTQVVDVSFGTNSSRICTELWSSIESKLGYTYTLISLHIVIPLILMVVSSLHIAYILFTRKIPGEVDKRRQEVIKSSKHKSVKVLVFMAITFAVSWLPLAVLTFIADVMSKSPNIEILWIICEMLTFMNCITIPVLYFWTNRRYREVLGEFSMKITGYYHIKLSVVHSSQSKNSNCSIKSNSSVEMNNFLSNIH